MSNIKVDESTCPPENLILIAVLYHIIMAIGSYVLLDGFEVGDEVLDV